MRRTAKIHQERKEEEEEESRGVWDCGSPLYDSYELVSLSSIIERHLMKVPSHGRSKRVAAAAIAAATNQAAQPRPTVISASSSSSMAGKKKKEKGKKYKKKLFVIFGKIGLLKKEADPIEH